MDFGCIVARQVRRDGLPAVAIVAGAVHELGADVQRGVVVRRSFHWKSPLETVLERFGAGAHAKDFGPERDIALLAGLRIPGDQTAVAGAGADASSEDQVRWLLADGDVAAFATARLHVVAP